MAKETLQFDADVSKVLQLVINSIYQNKDIFLRELISNASDACDKLRYSSLTKPELMDDDSDSEIRISVDKDNGTITISDNGIGMSRADIIKNLGTIANSGTQKFLEKLTGDSKNDSNLIGQFGVGFYSAFMVADKVTVTSCPAGKKKAHIWESKGDGKYSIDEVKESRGRGTTIILHMKEDEQEFLDLFRVRHIVSTYSNHIAFPIILKKEDGTDETINDNHAIWLRSKSEISDDEYNEFYKLVSHMGAEEPWVTLHNKIEGTLEYTSLLYVPSSRPFDLFHPERRANVKLYVNRVFIADENIDIIPSYLRFLRGVVDSSDLPLNISRETLQNNVTVQKIRRSVTNKVLSELAKKADKDKDDYAEFWQNFGPVIKEGLCDGMEPQDNILEVCRFQSIKNDAKLISLQDYVDAMQDGQNEIYFLTADTLEAAKSSPQLEGFCKKDIDVLLLTDSVDDFWVNTLHEYKGTSLKSVTRTDIDLSGEKKDDSSDEKKEVKDKSSSDEKTDALITYIKSTLGDAVKNVQATDKLTDSPVCLSVAEGDMSIRMERFLVENKQLPSLSAKVLEVNPKHPIIVKLTDDFTNSGDSAKIADTIHLLFAQASIVEGEKVSDISGFSRRLNSLLEKSLAA